MEDYNLFMLISAAYKTASLKLPLVYYRIHDNSITKSKRQYSDGVLVTLNELNVQYGIRAIHPFFYLMSYVKALRLTKNLHKSQKKTMVSRVINKFARLAIKRNIFR